MNTDKIFAEQLANEYSTKDTTKVVALRKLDNRAKLPAYIFVYTFGIISALVMGWGNVLVHGNHWCSHYDHVYSRNCHRYRGVDWFGSKFPNFQANSCQWKAQVCIRNYAACSAD